MNFSNHSEQNSSAYQELEQVAEEIVKEQRDIPDLIVSFVRDLSLIVVPLAALFIVEALTGFLDLGLNKVGPESLIVLTLPMMSGLFFGHFFYRTVVYQSKIRLLTSVISRELKKVLKTGRWGKTYKVGPVDGNIANQVKILLMLENQFGRTVTDPDGIEDGLNDQQEFKFSVESSYKKSQEFDAYLLSVPGWKLVVIPVELIKKHFPQSLKNDDATENIAA